VRSRDSLAAEGPPIQTSNAVAEFHATLIVDHTTDRAIRDEQLEAIAKHLACTSMKFHVVRFIDGGSILTRVSFPARPKVQ